MLIPGIEHSAFSVQDCGFVWPNRG